MLVGKKHFHCILLKMGKVVQNYQHGESCSELSTPGKYVRMLLSTMGKVGQNVSISNGESLSECSYQQ